METPLMLQLNYQIARFLTLFERLVVALEKIASREIK